MLCACEDLEKSQSLDIKSAAARLREGSAVRLTFPQPWNEQACTRLPFFALLIRPVGVCEDSMGPDLMVEEVLWRREPLSGGVPSEEW